MTFFIVLLSIIIVNYNVKHFLEQCLCSVQKAIKGIDAEIIVIDNNSSDNSLVYLRPKFPCVHFVINNENRGFAKACNQGLEISKGKYIQFLNPDTIVPEDCFHKCIFFLESKADAGALGIKMMDGSGKFLKESKRSFPSPVTSLYKLFGLSKLFPHSKTFSKYHLGHLDENNNQEVDVLAGAFMMIKKEVLDKIGSFDETFFMYGEDVDLSYRIQEAGYKNYYFAESSIIHFKGESTRKGSLNYVRMFYTAMSIFVRKHYGKGRAGIFNFLIHIAIWLRATMTAIASFIRRIGLPLIDAALILVSFFVIKDFWSSYVRPHIRYENKLLWISFPIFTVVYLLVAYYAGLYDRWYKKSQVFRSSLVATIFLLTGYSLLPEQYRFSRAIILLGAMLAFILIGLLRWILIGGGVLSNIKEKDDHANTLVVASSSEYEKTVELMKEAGLQENILGRIGVDENDSSAIGYWKNIKLLSPSVLFREIIFCEGSLSFHDIIESIQKVPSHVRIKIHAAGSKSIVGSHSRESSGEAVSKENGFKLSDPYNRRLKRLVDISAAVAGIIIFPIHLFFIKRPFHFLGNCILVLFAQRTWIGYATEEKNLPNLRRPIVACNAMPLTMRQQLPTESLHIVDYWYARDYEPGVDLKLIWKTYKQLGG